MSMSFVEKEVRLGSQSTSGLKYLIRIENDSIIFSKGSFYAMEIFRLTKYIFLKAFLHRDQVQYQKIFVR